VHRPFDLLMVSMTIVLIIGLMGAGGSLLAVLAANVKRMHDRGKSGMWVALFWIAPIALDICSAYAPAVLGQALSLIAAAISLWALIEMGFLRGMTGANEYGADPLDSTWGEAYRSAWSLDQVAAAAAAGRGTGFSTIGKLMSADAMPKNTPPHQMML
jgi:uncharacterized membrane protein YhaH (DUF805 family)